jgi:toxin ParE1/3/4
MSYRLSAEAEAQLDDIWLYIARESGSAETATCIVQDIGDRFWLLAKQHRMGRRRPDLSPELRSFSMGDYVILYSIEVETAVLVHYVFRGSQDIESSPSSINEASKHT